MSAGNAAEDVVLRLKDLTRAVDGKAIVDGVSLDVVRGDVLALVGPSGAGKSSLLRLINRLDEPTAGTVLLEGRDTAELEPQELRTRVGMVMQEANLFPGTVAENIRFGPRQRGIELDDDVVASLLERVRLPDAAGRHVGRLSGGEAQRVSLARTLANDPSLMLLDEPTSALDEATEREVEKLICQVLRNGGYTCLIVTHDRDQARRMATRVAEMDAGRLTRVGTVEEVL